MPPLGKADRQGRPEHPGEVQTDDPAAGRVNHGDVVIADGLAWMLAKDRTGGRRTPEKANAPPEPNTLGWFMALEEGQRRRREEAEY